MYYYLTVLRLDGLNLQTYSKGTYTTVRINHQTYYCQERNLNCVVKFFSLLNQNTIIMDPLVRDKQT